jgi:hypothetical protein
MLLTCGLAGGGAIVTVTVNVAIAEEHGCLDVVVAAYQNFHCPVAST